MEIQRMYTRFPASTEIAAAVMAFLPFVCSTASYSYSTTNGRVTEFSYSDPVAIGLGALAVLVGLSNLRLMGETQDDQRLFRIGLIIAVVLVGAYQVARGTGMLIDPQAFVASVR